MGNACLTPKILGLSGWRQIPLVGISLRRMLLVNKKKRFDQLNVFPGTLMLA